MRDGIDGENFVCTTFVVQDAQMAFFTLFSPEKILYGKSGICFVNPIIFCNFVIQEYLSY